MCVVVLTAVAAAELEHAKVVLKAEQRHGELRTVGCLRRLVLSKIVSQPVYHSCLEVEIEVGEAPEPSRRVECCCVLEVLMNHLNGVIPVVLEVGRSED